jgi:hypothetical protein
MAYQRVLGSIPSGQTDRISGFVEGARALLRENNTVGDEPMKIEVEFSDSGNCHILLVIGKWVGAYEASYDD